MDQDRKGEGPFDERAALEDLEHVRREIERYQSVRKDVDDEFERFIQSFKRPQRPPQSPPQPASVLPPVPPAERASRAPLILPASPEPLDDDVHLPDLPEDPLPPALVIAPPPASLVPPPRSSATGWLVAVSALAILAVGGYAWTLRDTPDATTATTTDGTPPAAEPSPDPSPAPGPRTPDTGSRTQDSAQRSPFESEVTAIRAVWVRVIADGQRVVERELQAGARVPFTAKNTIVIRTGDAGAVRLAIGGVDRGALGREGEVVTRTFAVQPPPPR